MSDFRKVYEEYAQSVYRFLLTLSGSEELAEELLQETFFQAYQHINGFEGRCNLLTWLCQIAKNAWLKECRRKKRYTEVSWEELTVQDPSQTPEERLLTEEECRRVRAAVLTLEEPYRDVFILHALGGIKLKEIANTALFLATDGSYMNGAVLVLDGGITVNGNVNKPAFA